MKPQLNYLKKFVIVSLFLLSCNAFSQTEVEMKSDLQSKNVSKITKKLDLQEGSLEINSLNSQLTPVLTKAKEGLKNKLNTFIIENQMLGARNSNFNSMATRE